MRSWLSLVVVLAACGTDHRPPDEGSDNTASQSDACEQSYLRYDNFGEPFILNWCHGCHSSSLAAAQRQKAPMTVNFDTVDDVRNFADRIDTVATSSTPTMPPAGGPSSEERAMLREWIECGAR